MKNNEKCMASDMCNLDAVTFLGSKVIGKLIAQ